MERVNFLLCDQLVHEACFGICDGRSAGESAFLDCNLDDRSVWGAAVGLRTLATIGTDTSR